MLPESRTPTLHSPDLFELLRAETDESHRRLEKNLKLLNPPTRERFVAVLTRFLGFHRPWETGLRHFPELAHRFEGRSRISYIVHDLVALGASADHIAAVDDCPMTGSLTSTAPRAMGSLYVMEGSTLGGAVIARALRQQTWVPADGLHYFAPPGRDVRHDWRQLKDGSQEVFPRDAWPDIVAGARDTFQILDTWTGGAVGD